MKFFKNLTIIVALFLSHSFFISSYAAEMDHAHKSVEAKNPYPSVDIKIVKDSVSGYNLQLVTKNFKFTPENINKAVIMNEGHAHLYINGKKIRIYSEWYHIDDGQLDQPINQIRVTLNANDHSEYRVGARPIEAMGAIKNENSGNWINNKK
jgi:hypothetical protein